MAKKASCNAIRHKAANGFQRPNDGRKGLVLMYRFATHVAKQYTRNATGELKPGMPSSTRLICVEAAAKRFPAFFLCPSTVRKPEKPGKTRGSGAYRLFSRSFASSSRPRISWPSSLPAPQTKLLNG